MLATMAFVFTGCSDDDDEKVCDTCTIQSETIEICDNGNDTYTLTAGGTSETVTKEELGGLPPAEFIGLICSLGDIAP